MHTHMYPMPGRQDAQFLCLDGAIALASGPKLGGRPKSRGDYNIVVVVVVVVVYCTVV